jgi:lipoate-protein ligase A
MILRVIPPLHARGQVHMAIDEWLLNQHLAGKQPPTLRFYTWEQPTISLGYHQKSYPEHWEQLPVEIVRRPTGGRAVLHDGDLTYMVVMSNLHRSHRDAYCYICQFLVQGWRSLGLDLTFGTAGRGYIHNPSCFGTTTGADLITVQGEKFIGSAQLRRGNALLQHGSMVLHRNQPLFSSIFGTDAPAPPPITATPELIIDTLTQAAGDCFGLEVVLQPLSLEEWEKVL